MEKKEIYSAKCAAACYFRSTLEPPYRKVLLQITERCNLRCIHCFVSAMNKGINLEFEDIRDYIVPILQKNKVRKITLTGGEPMCHPDFMEIVKLLHDKGFHITVCTNGVLINEKKMKEIVTFDNLMFNISLDGFSSDSHSTFRGVKNNDSFFKESLKKIELVSETGKLKGILCTPNKFGTVDEYYKLCEFAKRVGAKYALFNPLSEFGRGRNKSEFFGASMNELNEIRRKTKPLISNEFDVTYIRFPNTESLPLSHCPLGEVMYIFTNGDMVICPYVAFATKDINDKEYAKYVLGNLLERGNEDMKLEEKLDTFFDNFSEINLIKGCIAAKISSGIKLSDEDSGLLWRENNGEIYCN